MPGTVTELPKKNSKKSTPKAETPPIEYVKPSKEPFPPWPKGEGKGGYCKSEDLFNYWDALAPEFIARTNFYVNREHPKLDRMQELTDEQRAQVKAKTRRPPAKYIDKVATPWKEKDIRSAILRRYGSGDYKIFLNDAGIGGNIKDKDPDLTSRNLCRALYSVWDSDFPPILDPSRPDKGIGILDWTHPQNASYIAELRMKGIHPPNTKEEDDVPNDVVKTLVDQVGTLADKVAAHETDRLVERIAEKVNPQGNGASAASQIVDVMRAAKELNAPATPAVSAPSQESQLATTLQLVQTIMAMKADNPMAALYQAQMDKLAAEMKEYREDNRKLQEKLQEKRNNEDGTGGLEGLIDKWDKISPKLTNLLGLAGDKAADVVHGRRRPFYEEIALSLAPQLGPGLNSLLGAAAGYLMGGGQRQALGAPPPVVNANGQAALPAPAAPQDPLQPLRQKVGLFMQSNIKPLQKHFEDFIKGTPRDEDDPEMGKKDGGDFAYWVNESFGMDDLKAARELGSANIKAMFQQSPYWPAIAPYEAKFSEFLDQVLSFQPDEDEKEEDGKPVDLTEES